MARTVWRTPTSIEWASLGRNRWVLAESRDEAIRICRDVFGVDPVQVIDTGSDEHRIWEQP